MTITNGLKTDFSNGEVSQKACARNDLPLYQSVVEWAENCIALPQGPLSFRPGTVYIHHTRLNNPAVLIPFAFSDVQTYTIEATPGFFRFYTNGGIITQNPTTITHITNSNPAVVTDIGHGYSNGDEVFIDSVKGMTQINGPSYIVHIIDADHYNITDVFGIPIDSTSFGVYTTGGEAERIYEIPTPYIVDDLFEIQYAQNADVMYLVHRGYAPRKLTRTSDTNWTLPTFPRTNDPFTNGNYPGAITFTSDGRLMYGGSAAYPETIWASNGPDSKGNSRYDDFTNGTLATDSVTFTLAPINGKVDSIRWLSNTTQYIVCGTFSSVRRIYGATDQQAITPTAITAQGVCNYGAALLKPIPIGSYMLYVERGTNILREIQYNYLVNGYEAVDKTLVADQLLIGGFKSIANQSGNPEILWFVRHDGAVVTLAHNDKEQKYGWSRHRLANAVTEAVCSTPRLTGTDQITFVTKRTINGHVVRYVENLVDYPVFPDPLEFFTGINNKTDDLKRYENALYEKQKTAVFMDSAGSYDGRQIGIDLNVSVTPGIGALTEGTTGVVFISSANIFTTNMVGRQIWKEYDSTGNGGGRFQIDAYVSPTQVTGTILVAFDSVELIPSGSWFLTTNIVSNLGWLEGQTVAVQNDGAIYPSQTVVNGIITLIKQSSVINVGLQYNGIIKSLALAPDKKGGPAINDQKVIQQVHLRFWNSLGCRFGTSPYTTTEIQFRETGQITDRPVPLFTGSNWQTYEDSTERLKHYYILQTQPLPMTLISTNIYTDTNWD